MGYREPFGRVRPGYWFKPHDYGSGCVPVTAAGWIASSLYFLAIVLARRFMPTEASGLILVTGITIAFLILVAAKTDGGIRWRWGGK